MKAERDIAEGEWAGRQFERPWEALGYAVIEQAVVEFKSLCEHGLVVNGKCVQPWPARKADKRGNVRPKRFLCHYSSRAGVDELLNFFLGGDMEKLLVELQSKVSPSVVLKGIWLK